MEHWVRLITTVVPALMAAVIIAITTLIEIAAVLGYATPLVRFLKAEAGEDTSGYPLPPLSEE